LRADDAVNDAFGVAAILGAIRGVKLVVEVSLSILYGYA
jgi:hypothetical protein